MTTNTNTKVETKKAEPTKAQQTIVADPKLNTSQKIRALHNEGMSRGDIARILNKRYQHVRNVLITPIKKS